MKYLIGFSFFFFACSSVNQSGPQLFKLNFDQKEEMLFDFIQESKSLMVFSSDTDTSEIFSKGIIRIEKNEDGNGDISIEKVKSRMIMVLNGNRDTMEREIPTTLMAGMRNDATFEFDSDNVLFNILFPLPLTEFGVGDSFEQSMRIPYNMGGAKNFAYGTNILKFEKIEELNGLRCAKFTSIIDVSELKLSKETKGKHTNTNKGEATYYFDLERNMFYKADIKLISKSFTIIEEEVGPLSETEGLSDIPDTLRLYNAAKYRFVRQN